MINEAYRCFPEAQFKCYFEKGTTLPLVVEPKKPDMDLISWAEQNQKNSLTAIKKLGAICFSGFKLTKETFGKAFTALTGRALAPYKGDTPREVVGTNTYKSTAVGKSHPIPLHNEVSYGERKDMPELIAFFANKPSTIGGQTTVGNGRLITKRIAEVMPALWKKMETQNLTYSTTYLPSNNWRTRWIRWWNPSHSTIEQQFGTTDRKIIEAKCKEQGLTCKWDGDWLVVFRKGIPATIDIDGEKLVCNQIHLDRFNPFLCGGYLRYILGRLILYPSNRSMQFNVQFDNGDVISRSDASKLCAIYQQFQQGIDWRPKAFMIVNNATTLHGKTVHKGERDVLVVMGGSLGNSQSSKKD